MIIHRDYSRTERDDFVLRVQPKLDSEPLKEAMEIHAYDGSVVAWKIQWQYE